MERQTERNSGARGAKLGAMLREWRALRRTSQLALATNAEISQRHLSFIESGRARPSREMVLRIGEALDLPLRARNELLGAAGFASIYPERSLMLSEMERAREALERILAHHEPFPAMVLDRTWNIVMRNSASARIIGSCLDEAALARLSREGELNFMRMMFDTDGMRPHIASWERTASILIARLRREAIAYPGSPSESLLHELLPQAPALYVPASDDAPLAPTASLELETGGTTLRFFNTLTTFGTPQDVTLAELRIEMSFPLDDATAAFLRQAAL